MINLFLLSTLIIGAYATPRINLPINAQVPPVARVNRPFHFVFSESTFTSPAATINYTLSDSPRWLALDGPSRTFSGTPAAGDIGSVVMALIATDETGVGTMAVTLVVSTDSGPGLGLPVANQLPAYGAFSSPETIVLPPSSALSLSFSSSTFTNTNSETVYYALCANNTPLPSWIHFDPANLAFSGSTPGPTSPADISSSFALELTASNVIGFADAIVTFQIVVESQMLAFSNSLQIINVTAGSQINTPLLQRNLLLGGQRLNASTIKEVSAMTPSWLSLDTHNLAFSGTPPPDVTNQNFTVTVVDIFGDSASTVVLLQTLNSSAAALLNPIGAANATIGSDFVYQLNYTINSPGANVSIDLGTASSWLRFDRDGRQIRGLVPGNLKPQQVLVNITASQDSESQSEVLTIAVQSNSQVNAIATSTATTSATSASGQGRRPTSASSVAQARPRREWVAAVVLLPLAAIIGTAISLTCCWKRRRRRGRRTYIDDSAGSSKEYVSQPTENEKTQQVIQGPTMHGGLLSKRASSRISLPPRLPWIWVGGSGKRGSQALSSMTSLGERPPRPDSWQRFTSNFLPLAQTRLQPISDIDRISEEQTPRKAQTAERTAQQALQTSGDRQETATGNSASKIISKGKRASSMMSFGSSGQLYRQMIGGFGHGRRDPGRGHGSMLFGSTGGGLDRDPRMRGPSGFGLVQKSWRNINGSQSTSEWTDTTGGSSSQGHDHKNLEDHRRQVTIRPVLPSQTLSTRASKSSSEPAPPLLIPKSVRLRRSENPFLSAGPSYSRNTSHGFNAPFSRYSNRRAAPKQTRNANIGYEQSSPERQRLPRSYSRSSSLHPASSTSPSRPLDSLGRRLSNFDYSIAPRVIDTFQGFPQSDTRGSFMSMDPRYQSAVPSETQSLYNYDSEDDPFVTHEVTHAPWRPRFPSSIATRPEDSHDTRSGWSAAMLTSSRERGPLQKLSHLAPQLEDDSIYDDDRTIRSEEEAASINVNLRSPRAKRTAQQMGLRYGDPSNTSVRGEIKRSGSSSFL